jgi:hypothetical protein
VLRFAALPVAVLMLVAGQASAAASDSYRSAIQPLSKPLRAQLTPRFWRPGCPLALGDLRLLTVSHWDFGNETRSGQLIVHRAAAAPLASVFRRLYELRFPIRHLRLDDMYGPKSARPVDGDITGSFHCRESVPSPCTGGSRSGRWSNHAYGLAVDLNPVENPYVGCGRVRDPRTRPYVDRSRLRKGMVTPAVVQAFRSIGWGWGGDWTRGTKDYMHFSFNGR